MMELTTADLFSHRLRAAFREHPEFLKAWSFSVVNVLQVQEELLKMGWNEVDRVRAAHELCKVVMDSAPWGEQ